MARDGLNFEIKLSGDEYLARSTAAKVRHGPREAPTKEKDDTFETVMVLGHRCKVHENHVYLNDESRQRFEEFHAKRKVAA